MTQKKMKKNLSKLFTLLIALVLVVSLFETVSVSADEEVSPLSYRWATTDKVKKFTGKKGNAIIANCYYQRVVLTGFNKGIKKINKSLKKFSKKLDYKSLYSIAESDVKDGRIDKQIYNDFFVQDVNACGKNYVSIIESRYWWAGGVSNDFIKGYTFDLNTGKLLTPSKITGLSFEEIKAKYKEAIYKDPDVGGPIESGVDEGVEKYIDELKEEDFNYYINGDEFVAVMEPYTIYGGWARTYVLDGVSIIYE